MRTETLHEVLHAAPFRPFTLCLADGTRVDVPHPDFIAHPPGARSRSSWARMTPRITSTSRGHEIEIGPSTPAGTIAENPDGGE